MNDRTSYELFELPLIGMSMNRFFRGIILSFILLAMTFSSAWSVSFESDPDRSGDLFQNYPAVTFASASSLLSESYFLSSMDAPYGLDRHKWKEQSGFPNPLAEGTPEIIYVPGEMDLQTAIYQIDDGGIIEIADGIYPSPLSGFGINNLGKGFTIRAASSATVVLDGGTSRDIVRFINTSLAAGGLVVFEGLTFADGYSSTDGLAGGVTLQYAQAIFRDCIFQNNRGNQPSTGGGGVFVALSSTAIFINCDWEGNSAKNFGGGLAVNELATAYIHKSVFNDNRTNLPNHAIWAAGGAIHVGNSNLRVSNSWFEDNQAGYVGGGIYAIGNWQDPVSTPRSDIIIMNSTFVNNQAVPDPSVTPPSPTEGGALHAEDQTTIVIRNSRFVTNRAEIGGGVNLYRAVIDIYGSVFLGNQATGLGVGNGFGGAISAHSNDTGGDGNNNRRPASLTIQDSLIQGRYSSVTTVGQSGGGISIGGDANRTYGQNGVTQMGTVAENRAIVDLENVVFADLDVKEVGGEPGTGVAGAIQVGLTDLEGNNILVILSDALAFDPGNSNGSGGGMAVLDQSLVNITNATFAENTAGKYGGAIFAQGSTINLSDSNLIGNEISPGIVEPGNLSYGAAIFSSPDTGRNLYVTGVVENCLFSNNVGLDIYDDDRAAGPINDVRYNNNHFYSTTFGGLVHKDSVIPTPFVTPSELNSLVITRDVGVPSTDKSPLGGNISLGSEPVFGVIHAVPSVILSEETTGPGAPPAVSYLGYSWSGGSASLDGSPLSGVAGSGVTETSVAGLHTLSVAGQTYTVYVPLMIPRIFLPLIIRDSP
jgi:predicted outer membrane repeat protein